MFQPDLHQPAITMTVASFAPLRASIPAISADIRAIQEWRDRELELTAIREFGENWIGNSSSEPDVDVVNATALFLAICKKNDPSNPPARIALSPSGYMAVDWLDGDALLRAEITDLESNQIEWMRAIPGMPTEFWNTPLVVRKGTNTEQVQTWQPAQVSEGGLALAFAL